MIICITNRMKYHQVQTPLRANFVTQNIILLVSKLMTLKLPLPYIKISFFKKNSLYSFKKFSLFFNKFNVCCHFSPHSPLLPAHPWFFPPNFPHTFASCFSMLILCFILVYNGSYSCLPTSFSLIPLSPTETFLLPNPALFNVCSMYVTEFN